MKKIEDFANLLLDKSRKLGATAADVVVAETDDLSVSCRLGKPEDIERAESQGFGLRVFIGKKSAIISSSKFSDADELVERAISMASEATEDEFASLADPKLLAKKIIDLDLNDTYEPSSEELKALALATEDAALSQKGITNSDGASAGYSKYKMILATSAGFTGNFIGSDSAISVSVIAGTGENMQTDYDYSVARYLSDLKSPDYVGKRAAENVVKKLNPKKIKSGKMPVIFDSRIASSFLGDLAAGINGAGVARGTSYLKNKMGEQLFKTNINIIDDPHIKRGLGSKPFDAEGVANNKKHLIENGVLKTWIMDTRSANQLGLTSTGNAARSASSPPSPSTTNLYMENGNIPVSDMISGIKNGLLITETFGMGINYTTGDYSQGASGFLIENGKVTYPVSEITLAGNLVDIFSKITPANDLEFKGSTNAPTLLIEEMSIAGT